MGVESVDEDILAAAAELSSATPDPVEPAPVVAAPEPIAATEPEANPAETAEAKAERARDEAGRFAKGEKAPEKAAKAPPEPKQPEAAPVDPAAAAPAQEPAKPAGDALKAPSSWKPHAREKWASLPPEVQAEAVRLDREVRQTLQEVAPARKFAAEVQTVAQQYEPMLRAQGLSVPQALGQYLQFASALATGTAAQKAAVIHQLIQANGVDVEAVNEYLERKADPRQHMPQQPAQPQQAPPEYRDPRVDQMLAQQAEAEVERFRAGHEFFEDVRPEMADLVALAAKRGRIMTWEDAHKRACLANDDVQDTIARRKEAEAAKAAAARAEPSRRAAVSVRSQPAGVAPARVTGNSIEDDLRAAAEELAAR